MFNKIHGESRSDVAVIGLGAGAMAAMLARARTGRSMKSIRPVDRIARDTNCFTFLKLSRANKIDVVLGDARLRLNDAPITITTYRHRRV